VAGSAIPPAWFGSTDFGSRWPGGGHRVFFGNGCPQLLCDRPADWSSRWKKTKPAYITFSGGPPRVPRAVM